MISHSSGRRFLRFATGAALIVICLGLFLALPCLYLYRAFEPMITVDYHLVYPREAWLQQHAQFGEWVYHPEGGQRWSGPAYVREGTLEVTFHTVHFTHERPAGSDIHPSLVSTSVEDRTTVWRVTIGTVLLLEVVAVLSLVLWLKRTRKSTQHATDGGDTGDGQQTA